ncbi:MAG: pirin family protein [Vampirovibrionales bacterium]|nr:pirin family protein [Vampirovibrionales bacterium]
MTQIDFNRTKAMQPNTTTFNAAEPAFIYRPAPARGRTQTDWLDSWHSFSFGDYHDARWMHFGPLRVINEDTVAPAGGFAEHGHRDMDIITVVLSGSLAHQDSLGHGTRILPGDVQRMTAGRGIRHSEFNASDVEPVHFLQIWIQPNQAGLTPNYQQISVSPQEYQGNWRLIASETGQGLSVRLNQDVKLYRGNITPDQSLKIEVLPGRSAWLQVISGESELTGTEPLQKLSAGDGLGLKVEGVYTLTSSQTLDALWFDLPSL